MSDQTPSVSEALDAASSRLAELNRTRMPACVNRPGMKGSVQKLISCLRSALYPTIFAAEPLADTDAAIKLFLAEAAALLRTLLTGLVDDDAERERIVAAFTDAVPGVWQLLATDIRAAYDGDPAARSEEEIMLAYPAFEAVSIYRLAHELYKLGVPLLPRMMTETAHGLTGIDIHPGATIGPYFFIDHGTGVVIGETCTIGAHVKLYQGVTLGAKSFELDEHGNPVKGIKRHPDIGDHVVIYAGATILGGQTHIGDRCTIGGNVWLTHSVPAGETVYYMGEKT